MNNETTTQEPRKRNIFEMLAQVKHNAAEYKRERFKEARLEADSLCEEFKRVFAGTRAASCPLQV